MADKAPAAAGGAAKGGIGTVLSRPYLVGSVMLWLAYFMGLVIFYALINWMPILFRDAGVGRAPPRSSPPCSRWAAWERSCSAG
jgi:AAHS family 4-hydroxybenzoate transporter-like MFS transporter